jgi:hypothetical protein
MRRDHRKALALIVVLSCVACAGRQKSSRTNTNQNVLTGEQLIEAHFQNPRDALEALRPNWLKPRGPDSVNTPSEVVVYFDNIRLGGVETLRTIDLHNVRYIQHFDGLAATARYGVGHSAGVILVATHD